MAKSMLAEHAWERKFGEPLPTLADVMNEASQDDDDYVHIGYGKYKEKNMVDDPSAPTFKKDDSGEFVPSKGDDDKKDSKGGDEKEAPKGAGLGPDDFERDFEDDEEAKAAAFADMEDEFGDDMDESHGKIITINGKKYKEIEKEPIDASHCS